MATLVFGLGYIGAALAAGLLARGEVVVGLDNGFSTDWPAVSALAARSDGRLRLLRGDIRRAGDVEEAFQVAGAVRSVHLLAAQASAHPEAAPPEYTEETNLRGPRHVLEAALRHGGPPVVYGSSFHVYGIYGAGRGRDTGPLDESRPYGAMRDLSHLSKVYAEKLGEMYAGRGLTFAPVRLGVVYGAGPVMKRDLRFLTVPHAFCLRALAGQPLEVHPTGLSPIGFVHLDDAVEALRLAATPAGESPEGRPGYAPANAVGEMATALDVAHLVQRAAAALGIDVVVRGDAGGSAGGPAPPEVTSRLAAHGWRPARRLADGVPDILAYYRAQAGPAA